MPSTEVAADVGLGDLVHLNRRHHPAKQPELFNGVLERDRVDYRGKHAHVVGGNPVHVDRLLGDSAKEVASADDDADLAAERVDGGDFCGNFMDEDSIDAEALARGQGFSRDLEEDSFVHVRTKYRMGI
jgi:hypothetical protein